VTVSLYSFSRISTTFVKKKAALTLLRLYRKHPTVLPVTDWAERIVGMMDDADPGVALTVTSLVTALAQTNLEAFSGCYQKAVDRLDRVGRMSEGYLHRANNL
jgi:AP-2 complex subunit alpha